MYFQQLAIEASNVYYYYLEKHNGSLIKYHVSKHIVESVYCILTISQKIKDPSGLQLMINSEIYPRETAIPISYNEVTNEIKLGCTEELRTILKKIKSNELFLIVDLKFLVKNVGDFYKKYCSCLNYPSLTNHCNFSESMVLSESLPSSEQLSAIKCALSHPLSYIWGAPGTGKTQFVLANCILSYLLTSDELKVLITAPTNVALEQVLFGALPVLKNNGIDLNVVLRLGVPSSRFSQLYPECCENTEIEKEINKLSSKINQLKKEIESNNQIRNKHSHYIKFQEYLKNFNHFSSQLPESLNSFHDLIQTYASFKTDVRILDGKSISEKSKLLDYESEKEALSHSISDISRELESYNRGIKLKLFKRKRKRLLSKLSELIKANENNDLDINESNKKLSQYVKQKSELQVKIKRLDDSFLEAKNELIKLCSFNNSKSLVTIIQELTIDNYSNHEAQLLKRISIIEEYLNKCHIKYSECDSVNINQINDYSNQLKAALASSESDLDALLSNSVEIRKTNCKVLAATIDSCFMRVLPDGSFHPNHIFLDEAGYCSLIKAVALLAYESPLTLLGDHMQLPPVCEIKDDVLEKDKYKSVVLFSQSAIHIEEYKNHLEDIFDYYINNYSPCFYDLIKCDLNSSYRFSESIAKVLANNVYSSDFHGISDTETKIYYIDVRAINGKEKRTNLAEIKIIKKYINNHKNKNSSVILTPYRHQLALLKKEIKSIESLTVHKSQGQEWDTVIFSVVDTKNNKFLTNSLSKKSRGINVINTAISRAKKELIIVCDYESWKEDSNQLICKILQNSERIDTLL